MGRYIYTALLYLCTPFALLKLKYRAKRQPAYAKRWQERFAVTAYLPTFSSPPIWIHTVSVGETLAATPLIQQLKHRYPMHPILMTTTTPTGSEQVTALHRNRLSHCYFPYDLPCVMRRFLRHTQPKLIILMETELWPNMLDLCKQYNIPVLLANARLSERSAQGYARFAWLSDHMWQKIHSVAAQNAQDGQRFLKLGVPKARLTITGSIKCDIALNPQTQEQGHALRQLWLRDLPSDTPLFIAASTHTGEDKSLLTAFSLAHKKHPNLRLLLVPRHLERIPDLNALITKHGLTSMRRSEQRPLAPHEHVILGDSMGEMMQFFAASNLVFMGGSLIPHGGHNMLEPALYGLPIITGMHVFNFADISAQLLTAGGMVQVDSPQALANQLIAWLDHPELAQKTGQAAQQVLKHNQGALDRTLVCIDALLNTPANQPETIKH